MQYQNRSRKSFTGRALPSRGLSRRPTTSSVREHYKRGKPPILARRGCAKEADLAETGNARDSTLLSKTFTASISLAWWLRCLGNAHRDHKGAWSTSRWTGSTGGRSVGRCEAVRAGWPTWAGQSREC